MLGINSIHSILKEKKTENPAEILNYLRKIIKDIFKGSERNNLNGIDIALCSINKKTNILQYSGAFNPLWIVRNNTIIEIKATRNPIGYFPIEKDFQNNKIQLQNNDLIYLFSDGLKDQVGGKENKKYNNNRFKELISDSSSLPIKNQKKYLLDKIDKWQGQNEQIDYITIMGIEWKLNSFHPLFYSF